RLTEGLSVGRPVLAPEINFPAQAGLQVTQGVPAPTEWRRNEGLLRKTLAGGAGPGIDLRKPRRARNLCLREGRSCACLGDAKCRTAGQPLLDQLIQLGVAELRPPLRVRPGIGADSGVRQGSGHLQVVRLVDC